MSDAAPPTIEFTDVSKWFTGVVAVSELTLSITPGVTALLGPNGAGKSTVLRLMCGLTSPSRGQVRVKGRDPRRDPAVFADIGLVPQQEAVIEVLTAQQFVEMAADLSGVSDRSRAAAAAIELVDLDPTDGRPLRAYSKGMRQRIKVAAALVHEPDVIVLDEPLEGLDPRQRLRMIQLFMRLGEAGRTVIVSSHVLDEVQRFGSRVVVMGQGRLLAEGDFREIRDLMDNRPHRIRVGTDRP
nr:ABC transporter ATP-binding protein [Actinomycetota bacterium]